MWILQNTVELELIEIKIKDATIWQIRDVKIHQGKRPKCQRIRSLMNLWTLSHNFRFWNDHLMILYRTGSWGSLSKIDLNYRKNSKPWFKLLETLFQWAHFSFQFLSCLHSSESKELTIFGMKMYDRVWCTSTKDRKWGKT